MCRALCEASTTTGFREQLERRLAVAVLEILRTQPVAMDAQQQIALRARHQRNLIHRVERPAQTSMLR